MAQHKKKQGEPQQATPAGPARREPKVIPGTGTDDPLKRRPPKIRVIKNDDDEAEERLTLKELKGRFASNLDGLLGIIGLNRKDAAHEVGIPYKLMRRLAASGVSFAEERNVETLTRLKDYFALPSVGLLWRADLVRRLLTTEEGNNFVAKFRNRLLVERERRLTAARVVGHEEVTLVGRALGVEDADVPPLTGPEAEKVAAILASPKGDTFRRIIDDYHELVRRLASGTDEGQAVKGSTARA